MLGDGDARKRALQAMTLIGQALHAVQDFYAHSDYVERIYAKGGGLADVPLPQVWTADGVVKVRAFVRDGLVSGCVWWDFPHDCADKVPTHAMLAKDDDQHYPSGKKILARWENRTAYGAAHELADRASHRFLQYAWQHWPALTATCGSVVAYPVLVDLRSP